MPTDPFPSMSLAELADHCQEEVERFRAGQPSDEGPCLEIVRRAVVERSTRAWDHVTSLFHPQVRSWVIRNVTFAAPSEELIEDLTQDAFIRFWRFFDADAWRQMQSLRQVLAYLRSCAISAVAQEGRRQKRRALEIRLHGSPEAAVLRPTDRSGASELWAMVARHCRDDTDLILARLVLAGGVRPRQILEHYPHLFTDIRDVYARKRKLLDRLRRDTALRAQFQPRSAKSA